MHAWLDDLAKFARAIRGQGELPHGLAEYPGHPVSRAVEIYRNNYRGNLQGALAAAYPVIEQLVGKDFFRHMAKRYIETHPSHSGNLHHYGDGLVNFLTEFEAVKGLPYLPDVAKLEWACHRAYFAPDADTLDLDKLIRIDSEQYPFLRFLVHPACHVISTSFPAAAIWQAHQPGMPEDFHIELSDSKEKVLISRTEGIVNVDVLLDDEAAWLEQVQAGSSLGAATLAIMYKHPGFALQASLSRFISRDIVIGFEL